MKDYNWEYFKAQINKKLSEPITKPTTVKEKLMWSLFRFMKAIWGFPRISVRGINKTKRKLGFALMALTIRKVATQRVKLIKNIIKRQFLYNSNRNCLYLLSWKFMS